ncbi:MAG: MFS transporter [Chloroflexota bacterium]|nr:MFS transporter [Chloroflexota bacterium]
MTTAQVAVAPPPQPSRLSVLSWALYDLANTIFSMNIVSLYFGLWVVNQMGGNDADYGNANSISMALMFFTAPILGALSDQAGRRMPFLIVTTLLCVGFTALLGTWGLMISLLLFIVANYMFQAGLIFYDSLLPVVSTEENRGRVGGLGIGLGYMGSFIGVGAGLLLLDRIGYTGIFRLTAVLFLVFAIPCFIFVKERTTRGKRGLVEIGRAAINQTYVQGFRRINNWTRYFGLWAVLGILQGLLVTGLLALAGSQVAWWYPIIGIGVGLVQSIILMPVVGPVLHATRYEGLPRFLLGRVFYTDPVNTVIVFMGIYVTNEVGFSDDQAQYLLLISIVFAVIGGLLWGVVVDKIGPKRSLNMVLVLWMVVLALAALIAMMDLSPWLFWVVGTLAGIALGGTWAADRPYMLRLAPPRFIGEFYGLYSMVGRFGSIIGPFMWGYIAETIGLGRPMAILSLLVFIVIAFVILQGIDESPRDWPAELKESVST